MRDEPFAFVVDLSGAAQRGASVELIKRVLSLVNGRSFPIDRSEDFRSFTTKHFAAALGLMAEAPGLSSDAVLQKLEETNKFVTEIRILLGAVVGNGNGPLPEGLKAHIKALCHKDMRVSPSFDEDSAQFTLRVAWDVKNVRGAVRVALAQIAASRGLRSRLGRCALADCGDYFLDDVQRGGKRRLFCCAEHSDIGRARLYRERQKINAARARKHK